MSAECANCGTTNVEVHSGPPPKGTTNIARTLMKTIAISVAYGVCVAGAMIGILFAFLAT